MIVAVRIRKTGKLRLVYVPFMSCAMPCHGTGSLDLLVASCLFQITSSMFRNNEGAHLHCLISDGFGLFYFLFFHIR